MNSFPLLGMDLAYTANGYVYHTNYDTSSAVTPGSIQRAGDNILALVKSIMNSPFLANPGEYRHGYMVFYDFLGVVMIHYPERIGLVINMVTAFIVVLCLIKKFIVFPSKKDSTEGKAGGEIPWNFVLGRLQPLIVNTLASSLALQMPSFF